MRMLLLRNASNCRSQPGLNELDVTAEAGDANLSSKGICPQIARARVAAAMSASLAAWKYNS